MILPTGTPTESTLEAPHGFSIKASAQAFKILSSNLYSDKPLAILREIGCNALDAHKSLELSGVPGAASVPFSLILPTTLHPFLEITDFGPGLDNKEVQEVYTVYFNSTKSDSNDYIGALGLGSKSPFSYTDTFEVISRKDGVKTHYACFLNSDGAPSIYVLTTESVAPEVTGITVKIPVKVADFGAFCGAAKKAYRFFSIKPTVNKSDGFWEDLRESYSGSNFKYYDSVSGVLWAKMGSVAYPVDLTKINSEFFRSYSYHNRNGSFVVEFPIGSLDINAGRESLSYDEKTIANLKSGVAFIKKELAKDFQVLVDSQEDLYRASQKAYSVDRNDLFGLSYKGKKIDHLCRYSTLVPKINEEDKFTLSHWDPQAQKRAGQATNRFQFVPSNMDWAILVDDNRSYIKKLKSLVYSSLPEHYRNGRRPRIVNCIGQPSKEAFSEITKALDADGVPWKFMSDVEYKFDPADKIAKAVPVRSGFYSFPGNFNKQLITGNMENLSEDDKLEDFIYMKWDVTARRLNLNGFEVDAKDLRPEIWSFIHESIKNTGRQLVIVADKVWAEIPDHWVDLTEYLKKSSKNLLDASLAASVYGGVAATIMQLKSPEVNQLLSGVKSESAKLFIRKCHSVNIDNTIGYDVKGFLRSIFSDRPPEPSIQEFTNEMRRNSVFKSYISNCQYSSCLSKDSVQDFIWLVDLYISSGLTSDQLLLDKMSS